MENMINFPVLLLAALVPFLGGIVYYHPSVLGKAWMQSAGLAEAPAQRSALLLRYLLCVMMTFVLQFMVIHQYSIFSLVADEFQRGDMNAPGVLWAQAAMEAYGQKYRSFGHGALHGFMAGLFFALPLIGMNAIMERKPARYIWIHGAFWCICFMLMGGIICRFA